MQHFKTKIEHFQIYIYFSAIILGILIGTNFPGISGILETFVAICIAILMFSMFSQIPFFELQKRVLNLKFVILNDDSLQKYSAFLYLK